MRPDPRTTTSDIDAAISRLSAATKMWASTPPDYRRHLLLEVQDAVAANAADWVAIAADIKGLSADSPLVGEEWITGPWATIAFAGALAETLDQLTLGRDPLGGVKVTEAPGGRLALQVLPNSVFDRILLSGFSAEVWMQPGIDLEAVRAGVRQRLRHRDATDGVGLVLGAGNIFSIAPLDVLHQLYAENRVAILKLSPVSDPLLPIFERIFAPLIARGFVAIVTGDAQVGANLAYNPGISAVHITGSEASHDAIVWGSGPDAAIAKANGMPLLDKPITSELGGVAPVIVVPGNWSQADLDFQAQHVATQRLHNSGHNCIASQIVVLSAEWPQKNQFLTALRLAFADAPNRPTWYPGTEDRLRKSREQYPSARHVRGNPDRVIVCGLDLTEPGEAAFSTEYFAPVLGVAEIPGIGMDFINSAIRLSNTSLRGTLGATILIDPATKRTLGPALRTAIVDLRYGTVGINAWTGVGNLTARATWGAFPGHDLADVQSGRGIVHNALLLSGTERTVVTGPFRPVPRSLLHGEPAFSPTPLWFVNNKTAATTARLLTNFTHRPRWRSIPAILGSALRG